MIHLDNKIFGSFLVIKEAERRLYRGKPIHRYWTCLCNKCGEQNDVFQGSLMYGKSISCGCWRSEDTADKNRRRNKPSKLPKSYSGLNKLYKSYKNKSIKRNLTFDLSMDEFKDITSKNCFYCDMAPIQISTITSSNLSSRAIKHAEYIYNGIDRVDNTKGYEIKNCVPCCSMCNRAKRDYSLSDFINWINRVATCQNIKTELLISAS